MVMSEIKDLYSVFERGDIFRWFREGVPQADGTRKEKTMMSIYFGSRNGEAVGVSGGSSRDDVICGGED